LSRSSSGDRHGSSSQAQEKFCVHDVLGDESKSRELRIRANPEM
jgi:hypothetical protein